MKEKIICAVSYLWILFFLPLVLMPGDSKGKFHANQALLNLIVGVVIVVINWVVGGIPLVGWLVSLVLGLVSLAMLVWGIAFALLGEERPYPIIGGITLIK